MLNGSLRVVLQVGHVGCAQVRHRLSLRLEKWRLSSSATRSSRCFCKPHPPQGFSALAADSSFLLPHASQVHSLNLFLVWVGRNAVSHTGVLKDEHSCVQVVALMLKSQLVVVAFPALMNRKNIKNPKSVPGVDSPQCFLSYMGAER